MPGIHPTSRRQVRWAFAAEARGELPKGTARRWAHQQRCWTSPGAAVTKECADAMRILARLTKSSKVLPIGMGVKLKRHRRKAA